MTHYEVLQVLPTASPEVIHMAYKALARKYHPDVFQGNKEFAETKMKQINEAYRVIDCFKESKIKHTNPIKHTKLIRHLNRKGKLQ